MKEYDFSKRNEVADAISQLVKVSQMQTDAIRALAARVDDTNTILMGLIERKPLIPLRGGK